MGSIVSGNQGSSFKKNLRDELDYLDLTVKELSAKTGIAKGTLDCYLGARASMPPAHIAVKIAAVLGVSVEYLVTGKAAKARSHPFSPPVRSLLKIVHELDEQGLEIMLGLAQVLKNRLKKPR